MDKDEQEAARELALAALLRELGGGGVTYFAKWHPLGCLEALEQP